MSGSLERWLPIEGYEGLYERSAHGHVRPVAGATNDLGLDYLVATCICRHLGIEHPKGGRCVRCACSELQPEWAVAS